MHRSTINYVFLLFFVAFSCATGEKRQMPEPPVAAKIKKQITAHGHTRIDNYYWLRDKDNPDVIAYLEAENHYVNQRMAHTKELQQTLFDEMLGRIKQDDASAPWFDNGYYYYTRYEEGGDYPIYCRKKGSLDAQEEIIINVPVLAENKAYYNVGRFDISPDNSKLAFTADTVGRRQHTIYVKDLATGQITPTGIGFAAGDVLWAADGQTLFFTTIDPQTLRYDHVRKINLASGQIEVAYYEPDETYYYMGVSRTKDRKYITISCRSSVSNEIRILEASNPEGSFRVFQPRLPHQEYSIEHLNGEFYVLTNYNAPNSRLMKTPANRTARSNWREVIAHREDVLIENMEVFNDYIVLQERSNALQQMRIIELKKKAEHFIHFDEEAYSVSININREMDTNIFRLSYTSLTTPSTTFDYNMSTREKEIIWQQTVMGDFQPGNYITRRIFVEARDGARIPVTTVQHMATPSDQPNPLLQYGYGSYGSNMNPWFNSNLISLLDRGFIYAIAHIRGGQEMGRQWYEDGKFLNKINTFNDFIDVSEYFLANQYTTPEMLFASGGSAGGLLMGAIVNMRPELYRGILAAVPFVDVVTTMLDETIPLTTAEYDEWGNPNDPVYYEYMLSYSPYDQISRQVYPNILITSGLHDSQVQFWEPTKWTAKLREYNTGNNKILLQTNMEAGHGGASGRFRRLKEIALQYAFFIDLLE